MSYGLPIDPPDDDTCCAYCDDSGVVDCPECHRDGEIENDQHDVLTCPECQGDGTVPCLDCPTCDCGGLLREGSHRRCRDFGGF